MNEDIEYRLDEIGINAKSKLSKNKRSQKILDSLDELDQPVTLLSSIDEKIEGKKISRIICVWKIKVERNFRTVTCFRL